MYTCTVCEVLLIKPRIITQLCSSAVQSFIASLSLLWFCGPHLYCLGSLSLFLDTEVWGSAYVSRVV